MVDLYPQFEDLAFMKKYHRLFNITPETLQQDTVFSLQCGKGWLPILTDMFEEMTAVLEEDHSAIQMLQIKEKFGFLRVYYGWDKYKSAPSNDARKRLRDIIDAASDRSRTMCMICSKPSKIVNIGGWYASVCPSCLAEIEEENRQRAERYRDL